MDYRIFNVRTDANACYCARGCTDTVRESCTEGWLWEENPLPHRGIEPASTACQSDALPVELHPHPQVPRDILRTSPARNTWIPLTSGLHPRTQMFSLVFIRGHAGSVWSSSEDTEVQSGLHPRTRRFSLVFIRGHTGSVWSSSEDTEVQPGFPLWNPHTFQFPGWKCSSCGWKYFAAIIAACISRSISRIGLHSISLACLETLLGISQSEASWHFKRALSLLMGRGEICLHRWYSLTMGLRLFYEDHHNRNRARESYNSITREIGNNMTDKLVSKLSIEHRRKSE